MRTATTLEIRALIKDLFPSLRSNYTWTNKVFDPKERTLCFDIPPTKELMWRIRSEMFSRGYNNEVYETCGRYIRFRALFPG